MLSQIKKELELIEPIISKYPIEIIDKNIVTKLINNITICEGTFDTTNSILSTHINSIETQLKSIIPSIQSIENRFNKIITKQNFSQIVQAIIQIEKQIKQLILFEGYDKNIVVTGANGSGKSFYSIELSKIFKNKGILIPGQKILKIEQFKSVSFSVDSDLKRIQNKRSLFKEDDSYSNYGANKDFHTLLEALLIAHLDSSHKYREQSLAEIEKVKIINTQFDDTKQIWESLIKTKELIIDKSFKIRDKKTNNIYSLNKMSDGEKVLLFYTAQVILAPENSFIIIDEPESYLNGNIINKLWDKLENVRNDCRFIYITHDLNFVTTRSNFLKFWIKDFTYPSTWDIEKINTNYNNIPEELYLEILGSKEKILFCEGDNHNSLDKRLLEIFFGEKFTIKPVESCLNVINYTKSLADSKILNSKVYGLIDNDFKTDGELLSLNRSNIFSLNVAETENIFLTEEILDKITSHLGSELGAKNKIIEWIIQEFTRIKNELAIKYSIGKLNYQLNGEMIEEAKHIEQASENISKYLHLLNSFELETEVRIQLEKIEKLIEINDYKGIIKKMNYKGCFNQLHSKVGLNSRERMINLICQLLIEDKNLRNQIIKYYPEELIAVN